MAPVAAPCPDAVGETAMQLAYRQQRAVWRGQFLDLAAAGAFRAPEHLQPGLQAHLFLDAAMPIDQAAAEAA
jgi:hypothetical protein